MGAGQARKTNQVIRGWDFELSDISQTYRKGEMETEFNHTMIQALITPI